MKKQFKILLTLFSVFLAFAGCTIQTTDLNIRKDESTARTVAIKKLAAFSVRTIDIDYIVNCKARIVADEKTYSGSCQLILTRNHELQLTVKHPLGGVLLKIYADRNIIQVHDYTDKTYHKFKSTEKKRLNVPIIKDLSIVELQSILWGRLTDQASESLEYELEENRPVKMYKRGDRISLIVIYSRWLDYGKLKFPRILEMTNQLDGSSIKLAITQFKPGYAGKLIL